MSVSSLYSKVLCSLQSVSDLQVSVWLEHPKPITTGINRRQFSLRVTRLQIKMGQGQKDKSKEKRGKNCLHLFTHISAPEAVLTFVQDV